MCAVLVTLRNPVLSTHIGLPQPPEGQLQEDPTPLASVDNYTNMHIPTPIFRNQNKIK